MRSQWFRGNMPSSPSLFSFINIHLFEQITLTSTVKALVMNYNVSKCQQNDTRVYEGCKEVISNKPNTCLISSKLTYL